MPLPMIVPATIEVACHTFRPRTNSGLLLAKVVPVAAFCSDVPSDISELPLEIATARKHSDAHVGAL